MKNIVWLKNEVNELPLRFIGFSMLKQREEFTVSKDDVLELIYQLDEPEVLSQEWIDKYTWNNHYIGRPFVYVDDLQNLLVPKLELPVIPDYVAEWIEKSKENKLELGEGFSGVFTALDLATNPTKDLFWIKNNQELFTRAWLDGYTVEEKKYWVIPPHKDSDGHKMYLTTTDDGVLDEEDLWFNTEVEKEHYSDKLFKYKFTKEEVKKIEKGAYWAFALPVEELEE